MQDRVKTLKIALLKQNLPEVGVLIALDAIKFIANIANS